MVAEARRLQIIDTISHASNGVVSVVDLSQELGVSEMTIRRDLDWLEERAIVRRVHGGAVAYQATIIEKPFDDRLLESNPQKKTIGWTAAQLVNDGDRIILDAGTTTQQVARNLTCKNNLTVITNNLPVAMELSHCPNIKTIVLGGELKHKELCTIGGLLKEVLASFSADKYFLSATGFTVKTGITDPDLQEVEVKQAMARVANEVILVVDSSKFGVTALMKIAPLGAIHKIVTDDAISSEAISAIEEVGVDVITPERMAAKAMLNS